MTDPPYGLSFMGKKWDYDVPSKEIWQECLRVLKPGGHLLAFGGTRTYHRLVVNIEDAGFEIRDQIQWLYGSGFPKSTDVSKRIDKEAGATREVIGFDKTCRLANNKNLNDDNWEKIGTQGAPITKAKSEDAIKYQGWGSALKPANEPICVARKPLEKGLTLAANVLKYGTGAINIDESRIGFSESENIDFSKVQDGNIYGGNGIYGEAEQKQTTPLFKPNGRWPANIILDEVAAEMLDEQSGKLTSGSLAPGHKRGIGSGNSLTSNGGVIQKQYGNDSGGASRFFYVAKASKSERNRGLKNSLIWESESWEKQDLNLLMENTNQLAKATSEDTTTEITKWSTELSGNLSTDQCPQDLIYTILTASKLITELKISNVSQNSNTKESIQDAIRMIEVNGLSLVESVDSINRLIPSITNEKTASLLGAVLAVLQTLLKIKDFAKQGNFHSTVKPIKLMEYLIRLVTPAGGTTLDPFMGSGTTGVAAKNLGFNFVGIELNVEYMEIAEKRISNL